MEYIIDNAGKKRKAIKVKCDYCAKEFLKSVRFIREKNYCSTICAKKAQITSIQCDCDLCGAKFWKKPSRKSKSGLQYCSRSCKDVAQKISSNIKAAQLPHYGLTDKTKYREKAFLHYPHECEVCKHNKYVELLQVHHIDSDRSNSNLDNLIILCAICHWGITLGKVSMAKDRKWIYETNNKNMGL